MPRGARVLVALNTYPQAENWARWTGAADQAARPEGKETEVFAYGRLPLAFSARCFTARHYSLQKDDCRFRCLDQPGGERVRTLEGDSFLTPNGADATAARRLTEGLMPDAGCDGY
jgi:collagenase-like PrtC family protease